MKEKIYNYSEFCGLFGYPIKHSLSPLMHNLSFDHYGMDWVYLLFNVEPEEFEKLNKYFWEDTEWGNEQKRVEDKVSESVKN